MARKRTSKRKKRLHTLVSTIVVVILLLAGVVATWPEPVPIMDSPIRQGNEPRLRISEGADTGVILLHGFGASPWEMRELADFLFERNYTVYNVRTAGHGTNIGDFARTSWQQWHQSAREAHSVINEFVDHIYVIGLSTGGSIALLIAQSEQLDGVVVLNAPIWLQDGRTRFAKVAKFFTKSVHKTLTEEEKPYVYDTRPLAAIGQLMDLLSVSKNDLDKVTDPVLLIQTTNDPTVKPKSAQYIYDNIGSRDRKIIWYEADSHVLTRGDHTEYVFPMILEFLEK